MNETDKEHYFDWAATSPADEDILRESLELSLTEWGNPSSIHTPGTKAKAVLSSAREKCAQVLGVKAETLYFTSGGTESDHIPLLSMLTRPNKGTVLVSALEHPALREQCAALESCGIKTVTVPSDRNGFVTPQAVIDSLTDDTVYVAVMAVNNETGAVQDIYAIADALTKTCSGKRRPHFHVDCVQACGKIPLDLCHSGIDSAAFSAHKICGPRGIGLLYLAKPLEPFLRGGGQEKTVRSGTENLFGAVAFSKALERYFIRSENTAAVERYENQKLWTKEFIASLAAIKTCSFIPPSRTDETQAEHFSPWVVQASFRGIPGQVMVRALDAKGFYISTGSACSAKKQSRPILEAMHVSSDVRESAVRFSFGAHTTRKAMQELVAAVQEVCSDFSR